MKRRWPVVIAFAGVVGWSLIALITWNADRPLGHDEAQYAIAARDVLHGEPARWFYLSRGMNVVAIAGVLLGGSEHALRLMPMVLGVGFAVATYAVARRTVSALAAAWTLVVLATSRTIVRMASDLLSDMPAAACLLAAVALIVGELERPDGARWRIVAVGPLFGAAFYIRYGSVIPIAVIVGASILVGARTLARRPLPVLVAAASFLICLVPHLLESKAISGSMLGILRWCREVPNQPDAPNGLVTYLTSNPFRYYGPLTTFALAAGVLAGIHALLVRDRKRVFIWFTAIATLIAMGLTTHAMVRYILVPVALLVVLGTDLMVRGLARGPEKLRRVVPVVLAGAFTVIWILIVRRQLTADTYREHKVRGTLHAIRVIRNDARGTPCTVIGSHTTELDWYSGCSVPPTLDRDAASAALAKGDRVYVVIDYTPGWMETWNPDLAAMPGTHRIVFVNPERTMVVRLDSAP